MMLKIAAHSTPVALREGILYGPSSATGIALRTRTSLQDEHPAETTKRFGAKVTREIQLRLASSATETFPLLLGLFVALEVAGSFVL
jgi:hypothetical protein